MNVPSRSILLSKAFILDYTEVKGTYKNDQFGRNVYNVGDSSSIAVVLQLC